MIGWRITTFYGLLSLAVFTSSHLVMQWPYFCSMVPLSVIITWAYAFFLTAGGANSYKGCSSDIPSSNILIDASRKHAYTMKHCRTDVSDAWRTAAWIRIPYPLQWGIPIFHLRTSIIMIIVSLVVLVDSVKTYHSSSLRINSRPPTPGIVSKGIGVEGFCSVLAGLWGSGAGSTTLTENVHTINITKVANRRALELGAAFLILFSFIACPSTFPRYASDYALMVPNGRYAITASHCVQCSCVPGSQNLYYTPVSLAVSCSSMQCRNNNLMLGNVTVQQSSAGCNVTSCSYGGFVNGTIITMLSTSLQP